MKKVLVGLVLLACGGCSASSYISYTRLPDGRVVGIRCPYGYEATVYDSPSVLGEGFVVQCDKMPSGK